MKLLSRSEYFKTAMETGVGEKTMFIEVKECPHHVLDTRAAQLLPTHDVVRTNRKTLGCPQ